MQAKLEREDLNGVGVKVTCTDNTEIYYFYEDFGSDKGIDRASRHFQNLIDAGKVRKAEYFYKDTERIEYLKRYKAVMKKLNAFDLLGLPDRIKEVLQNTTDLKVKVEMLEEIAKTL